MVPQTVTNYGDMRDSMKLILGAEAPDECEAVIECVDAVIEDNKHELVTTNGPVDCEGDERIVNGAAIRVAFDVVLRARAPDKREDILAAFDDAISNNVRHLSLADA